MSRNKDELITNETVAASPLRRSTRIAQNVPTPAAVSKRRSSASEDTSTPARLTRSRRTSLSQESNASSSSAMDTVKTTRSLSRSPTMWSQESETASTRKTRRGSVSRTVEENKEISTPSRRTRASSRAESLSPSEKTKDTPLKITRPRRSSVSEKEPSQNDDRGIETKPSVSNGSPEKQNDKNSQVEEDSKESKKITKRRLSLMDNVTPLEAIEEREDVTNNQDIPLKKRKHSESATCANLSIIAENDDNNVRIVENVADKEKSEKTSSPILNTMIDSPKLNENKSPKVTEPSSPTKKTVSDSSKLKEENSPKSNESEEQDSSKDPQKLVENKQFEDEKLKSPSLIRSPIKSDSVKLNTSKRKSLSLKSECDGDENDLLQDEDLDKSAITPLVNSSAINDSNDSLRLNLSSTILNSSQNLTDKSITPKKDKLKEKSCSPNENDMNKVNSSISHDKSNKDDVLKNNSFANLEKSRKEYSFYEPMEVDEISVIQNVTVDMSKNNELLNSSKNTDTTTLDKTSPKKLDTAVVKTNQDTGIATTSQTVESIEDVEKSLKTVLADTSPSKNNRNDKAKEKLHSASPTSVEQILENKESETSPDINKDENLHNSKSEICENRNINEEVNSKTNNVGKEINSTDKETQLDTTCQEKTGNEMTSEKNDVCVGEENNQNKEKGQTKKITISDEDEKNLSEEKNDETNTNNPEEQDDSLKITKDDNQTNLNGENKSDKEKDNYEENRKNETDQEDEQNENDDKEESPDDSNENSTESSVSAKLEYLIKKKIEEDESDSSDEDFVLSEVEEGEEDTPSIGSNEIIDEGESIGSSCEAESLGSYDDNDSFIDDGDVEILEGFTRILKPKDSTDDEDELEELETEEIKSVNKKSEKGNESKRYKRIKSSMNNSEEESNEDEVDENVEGSEKDNELKTKSKDDQENVKEESQTKTTEITPKELHRSVSLTSVDNVHNSVIEETDEAKANQNTSRKRSISLSETIRVEDVKSESFVEQISQMMNVFCSNLKDDHREVSLNVSLEYFDNEIEDVDESKTSVNKQKKISIGGNFENKKSPKKTSDSFIVESTDKDKSEENTESSSITKVNDMKRKHSMNVSDVSSTGRKKLKMSVDSEDVLLVDDDQIEMSSSEVSKKKRKRNKRNKRNANLEQNKVDVSSPNQSTLVDWQVAKIADEKQKADKKHKKKEDTASQEDEVLNESVIGHDMEQKKKNKKKKKKTQIDNKVEDVNIEIPIDADQEIIKDNKKKMLVKKLPNEKIDITSNEELQIVSKKSSKTKHVTTDDDQEMTTSKKKKFNKKQPSEDMDAISSDKSPIVSKNKKSKKATETEYAINDETEISKPKQKNKKKRSYECEVASDDDEMFLEAVKPKKKKKNIEFETENFMSSKNKKKSKQEKTETIMLRNKKEVSRTGEMFGITPSTFKDFEKPGKASEDAKKAHNSSWIIEEVKSARPSTSNVKSTSSYAFHSKDFKNKMLFESGRVNRESAKDMLKRKQKKFL